MDQHPDYYKYIKPAFINKPPDNIIMQQLYREFLPLVVNFLRRKGEENQMTSEDVFQDSLSVVFLNVRKKGFQLRSSLKSYLFGISQRVWLNHKRKNNKVNYPGETVDNVTTEAESPYIDEATELLLTEVENRKKFEKAFGKLKQECQLIVELRLEGLSYREIISLHPKLGNEAATRQKYHRCINKLGNNYLKLK